MIEVNKAPITVYVALADSFEAEACAARIDREPGYRAELGGKPQGADVILKDQCRSEAIGPNGEAAPWVVVGECEHGPCVCCSKAPRDGGWPLLFRKIAEAAGREPFAPRQERLDTLTRREMDVLRLVGLGMSVAQCAEELGVSPSTVGNHKYRLMRKLDVSNSLQLLRIAVRSGVADVG